MPTYYMLLGVFLGIGGTIAVMEIAKAISIYKDRKQAEFDAAVERVAARKYAQSTNVTPYLDRLTVPPDPYTFDDDPFRGV